VAMTYYGEEIGMLDGNIANSSDTRDKERTPMQWNKEQYAGESTLANILTLSLLVGWVDGTPCSSAK